MAIGRPISLTPNIATKNISSIATANQTEFTVTGGYRINEIAVYRNGVRLADGRDFTASDGDTVNLVNGATVDDVIEFAVFDSFNVADAIVSAASSQSVNGDLNVTGNLYAGTFEPSNLVATASTITRITNTNLVATASTITSLVATAATFNSIIHVGSALTAYASGDIDTIGIITASNLFVGTGVTVYGSTGIVSATTFYGDGSNLSNITSTTINNNADNRLITGSGTANTLNGESNLTFDGSTLAVTGTITGAVAATTGAFSSAVNVDATTASTSASTGALIVDGGVGIAKDLFVGDSIDVTKDLKVGAATTITGATTLTGAVNIDATTDSTSVTTGALIVDGGLGVAKNVYIGAGLSVAGTLTYEDVTSVDSVGMVTAKSGVNITGGQLTVGSGLTIGYAGVATFSGTSDVHLTDGVQLKMGDSSDFQLYHDGTKSIIKNTTGALILHGASVLIKNEINNEVGFSFTEDGTVELHYDDSKKLETTNTGVTITGNATATKFLGDGSELTGVGGEFDITSCLFV